jgi:putative transposase
MPRHEERVGETLPPHHNATDKTIGQIDKTDEKTHDSTLFMTEYCLHGWVFLVDMVYFTYRWFALIDKNDGYFVSQLK